MGSISLLGQSVPRAFGMLDFTSKSLNALPKFYRMRWCFGGGGEDLFIVLEEVVHSGIELGPHAGSAQNILLHV